MTTLEYEIAELNYLDECLERARTRRDEMRIDTMEEFIRRLNDREYIQS